MKRPPHFKAMLRINLLLFYGCFLAGVSWLSWPETAESWRSGVMSIFCGMSAFGLIWQGADETIQHIKTLRRFEEGVASKRKPHSDSLAGSDELRKAGMVD